MLDVKKQMWQVGVIYSNKYQELVYVCRGFHFRAAEESFWRWCRIWIWNHLSCCWRLLLLCLNSAGSRKTDALFISLLLPAGLILQQSKLREESRPGKRFFLCHKDWIIPCNNSRVTTDPRLNSWDPQSKHIQRELWLNYPVDLKGSVGTQRAKPQASYLF